MNSTLKHELPTEQPSYIEEPTLELDEYAEETVPSDSFKRSILADLADNIVHYTQSQLKPIYEDPNQYLFWMQIVIRLSSLIDIAPNYENEATTGKVVGYISESLLKFLSTPGSLNSERATLALLWLHHEWYKTKTIPEYSPDDTRVENIYSFIVSSFCDEVKCSLLSDNFENVQLENETFENTTLESQIIRDKVTLLLESRDTDMLNISYFLSLSPIVSSNVLQSNLFSILSSSFSNDIIHNLNDANLGHSDSFISLRRLCYVLGVSCKLCILRPKVRSFLMPIILQFLSLPYKGYRQFSICIILQKLLPLNEPRPYFFSLLKDFAIQQLRELSINSTVVDFFYGYHSNLSIKKEGQKEALSSVRCLVEKQSDIFFAICMKYPYLLTYLYTNWKVYFMEDICEKVGDNEGDSGGTEENGADADREIVQKRKTSALRFAICNIYNSEKKTELINSVIRAYQKGGECFFGYLINCLFFDADNQNIAHRLDKDLVSAVFEIAQSNQLGSMFIAPLLGGLDKVNLIRYLFIFLSIFMRSNFD